MTGVADIITSVKHRIGIPTHEAHLVRKFVRQLRAGSWGINHGTRSVTLTEVESSQGWPDVVHAGFQDKRRAEGVPKALRLKSVADLIAKLRVRKGSDLQALHRMTGYSQKVVRSKLSDLKRLGIARESKVGSFHLSSGFQLPRVEVWAFEAKIKDWKKALYQALQYRGFAHRIYIVMPKDRELVINRNANVFRRFGVGVILLGTRGPLTCPIAAKSRAPHSRAMHFRLIGELLHRAKGLHLGPFSE